MNKLLEYVAGILLAMLVVGCAAPSGVKAPVVDKVSTTASTKPMVPCASGNPECYTILVQNFEFKKEHPLLSGLDKPAKDNRESEWRESLLPVQANEEYKKGRIKASKPRPIVIHFWGIDREKFLARMVVSANGLEDVTGKVALPRFDKSNDRGKPALSLRLTVGSMGAVHFPWNSAMPTKFSTLVCTEDRETIYPNRVTSDEGLWVMENQYDFLRKKGSKLLYMVLFSKPVA